jgi:DNA processing protein
VAALKYWVWLTALPGLSNRSRLLLLERYGSPEDVYYADAEELALTEGLTPGQAQLLSDKSLTRADRILADCARGDIFLLTMQDARPAAGHFRPAGAAVRQGVAAAV